MLKPKTQAFHAASVSFRIPARGFCAALFLLSLSAPRCCGVSSDVASAQAPREGSWAPAPLTRMAPPPVGEPENGEIQAEETTAPAPEQEQEPLEVQTLRATRAKQAALFREFELVREEERTLKREDRELYPITGPLIAMATGFGMSAFSLAISWFSQLTLEGSSTPMAPELKAKLIALHVIGLPTGVIGAGIFRHRLRRRPNRERIRKLESERVELRRELRRVEQDPWSLVPVLSGSERSASLSVRHAF